MLLTLEGETQISAGWSSLLVLPMVHVQNLGAVLGIPPPTQDSPLTFAYYAFGDKIIQQ